MARVLVAFVVALLGVLAFPVALVVIGVLFLPVGALLRVSGVPLDDDVPASFWYTAVMTGLAIGVAVGATVLASGEWLFPAQGLRTAAVAGGIVAAVTGAKLGRGGFPGASVFIVLIPATLAGAVAAAVAAALG